MGTVKPILSRDLKRIFKGREFTRRLSQAADDTSKYWIETQFNVVRTLFNNKLVYGDVVSKSDFLDDPHSSAEGDFLCGVEELIEELDIYNKKVFPLIMYHMHPPLSSSDPSPNDLWVMANLRLWAYEDLEFGHVYDNRPLFIVGSIPGKYRLDLLVLQEKLEIPMGKSRAEEIVDFIEMSRDYDPNDNNIIARLLNSRPELNAILLSYERNGKGTYRISDKELAKLERFSYQLELLPKKS